MCSSAEHKVREITKWHFPKFPFYQNSKSKKQNAKHILKTYFNFKFTHFMHKYHFLLLFSFCLAHNKINKKRCESNLLVFMSK